ncbi:hypothetical protein [uncultured Nostoc sp.]|uniref:hypothetical protein n=1 Tax=uncultured Nostoc sp. TaxID=340711 RepID=UPI0035C955B3
MASRQKAKPKFTAFIKIRQWLNFLKTYLVAFFVVSTSVLKRLLLIISHNQKSFLVLLLLLFLTILTFAAIVPVTHTFEGNIIAQEMSFTYQDKESNPFLQNIRDIKQLENEGSQTLTFTGNFQSAAWPELNKLDSLKIQLKNSKSRWIIAPVDPKSSTITLHELRLQPNAQVAELSYDFFRNQLAFSLKINAKFEQKSQPNKLDLYLGEQPMKVILEDYELIDVKLPNQPDKETPLEFSVKPNNRQFNLEIAQNTKVVITLAKPPKYESEQWFQEEMKTKDVQFIHKVRSVKNPEEDFKEISTIVEGKIRMAEQERDIKQNQFLMGENSQTPLNIEKIRHLEIVPKKGIEGRFSGKTKQIQIGLDQDFPVSRIQGSWLDGVLPRDAIIALFSFGAATIANLLSWLFSNPSKSNTDNSN